MVAAMAPFETSYYGLPVTPVIPLLYILSICIDSEYPLTALHVPSSHVLHLYQF